MKIMLNLMFVVLLTAGVYGTAAQENSINRSELSQTERLCYDLKRELQQFRRVSGDPLCQLLLSPEQILFGNQKYAEFNEYGNGTLHIFFNKLDNDIKFESVEDSIDSLAGPICAVFDDLFKCIGQFGPVIDLCLAKPDKILKDKLVAIVPLIHQSMCLRNGALITEIVQYNNSEICVKKTINAMINVGVYELFVLVSDSDELFGDARFCQGFSKFLNEFYTKVGECSPGVLDKVKDLLGFFCEHTRCDRFVDDLRCY